MNGHAVAEQLFDPRLSHLLALRNPLLKALRNAGDTHTVQDIADGILDGRFQFWGDDRAGIITEVLSYPRKRAVNYFLVLGDMDACLALQPEIEAFAKQIGAAATVATGRQGWDRILGKHGWTRRWSVHTKALT